MFQSEKPNRQKINEFKIDNELHIKKVQSLDDIIHSPIQAKESE